MNENGQVLVVDDDPGILELVTDMVEELGFKIIVAKNGEDAIKIIDEKGETIDLVLTDINIQGKLDGMGIISAIKSKYPFKPILIFMSGYDIPLDDIYANGVSGILRKPFNMEDLEKLVQENIVRPSTYHREYERFNTSLTINMKYSSIEEGIESQTINIGQGGMFIKRDKVLKVGNILNFIISFSRGKIKQLEGQGEVMWVRDMDMPETPSGMGIKFLNMSEDKKKVIKEYVESKKIISFIPKK